MDFTKEKSERAPNEAPPEKNVDVYAFGFNVHGQVDGLPSEMSVLKPKIVHFFIGKKVTRVAACRSRSLALADDG